MDILVSKKYKNFQKQGQYTCFSNLKDAINNLNDSDVIFLENEEYYGMFRIEKNNIKIYGKDNSIITYDAYNSLIVREDDGGDGIKKYGTTGSSTIIIKGNNFYASNVTFMNSFLVEESINGRQAVALKVEGNNSHFEECKFIGRQDTLYIDKGNYNKFDRCYIEGDVDFIFGSANVVFNNCDIVAKRKAYNCYFTAPSTINENEYGFLFYQCKFFTSGEASFYLMRPWFPSETSRFPKAMFIDCFFEKNIQKKMVIMHENDPIENAFLEYFNCIQNDEIVSSTNNVVKYYKFI